MLWFEYEMSPVGSCVRGVFATWRVVGKWLDPEGSFLIGGLSPWWSYNTMALSGGASCPPRGEETPLSHGPTTKCMGISNDGLNPLKPWAKVNPPSLPLFMSGVLVPAWESLSNTSDVRNVVRVEIRARFQKCLGNCWFCSQELMHPWWIFHVMIHKCPNGSSSSLLQWRRVILLWTLWDVDSLVDYNHAYIL
jgi:hypothetical protein